MRVCFVCFVCSKIFSDVSFLEESDSDADCQSVTPPETFAMAFVRPDLGGTLPLVASGKVRELYNVDSHSLLFVASDRISAYDVIMKNVRLPLFNVLLAAHRQMNPT